MSSKRPSINRNINLKNWILDRGIQIHRFESLDSSLSRISENIGVSYSTCKNWIDSADNNSSSSRSISKANLEKIKTFINLYDRNISVEALELEQDIFKALCRGMGLSDTDKKNLPQGVFLSFKSSFQNNTDSIKICREIISVDEKGAFEYYFCYRHKHGETRVMCSKGEGILSNDFLVFDGTCGWGPEEKQIRKRTTYIAREDYAPDLSDVRLGFILSNRPNTMHELAVTKCVWIKSSDQFTGTLQELTRNVIFIDPKEPTDFYGNTTDINPGLWRYLCRYLAMTPLPDTPSLGSSVQSPSIFKINPPVDSEEFINRGCMRSKMFSGILPSNG